MCPLHILSHRQNSPGKKSRGGGDAAAGAAAGDAAFQAMMAAAAAAASSTTPGGQTPGANAGAPSTAVSRPITAAHSSLLAAGYGGTEDGGAVQRGVIMEAGLPPPSGAPSRPYTAAAAHYQALQQQQRPYQYFDGPGRLFAHSRCQEAV
jgi:hypothetical protein